MRAAGELSRVVRFVASIPLVLGCGSTVLVGESGSGGADPSSVGSGGTARVCPDGPAASPSLNPLLHYPLDADVRNQGTRGDTHDGIGAGETFGQGVLGGALVLSAPAFLLLPNTAEVLASQDGITVAFRFREPGAPAVSTPFFDCRNIGGGVQFFRGDDDAEMSNCWGGGPGPDACVTVPVTPGPWHHVLYERASSSARVFTFVDGQPQGSLNDDGDDVFAGSNDILLGTENVGDFSPSSTIAVDDLRVYDRVILDKCAEFGAPFCPCR